MIKNIFKDEKENLNSILFIHQGFELYGSDKSLLRNIKAVGIKYPNSKITVILPQKGILSDILKNKGGIDVRIMPMGVLRKYDLKHFNFSIISRITTYYKQIELLNQFDLVFINSIVVIDFILASRYCKSKVIIHVREIPTGIQRYIFSKLLSFSNADLIFVSATTKEAFSSLSNKNQVVLLNGCKPIKKLPNLDRNNQYINILLPGRINSWKGQPLLVSAISKLSKSEKDKIRVRILGDVYGKQNYLKSRLISLINKKQLKEVIEIIPFTKNPEIHYNWADVVVVPSLLPEPFGLVAIEAMSIGKLVIAAEHGGLTEIIQDRITGLFFKPRNDQDLADKISEVLKDKEIITNYGKNGVKVFIEKFSDNVYFKNFIKII